MNSRCGRFYLATVAHISTQRQLYLTHSQTKLNSIEGKLIFIWQQQLKLNSIATQIKVDLYLQLIIVEDLWKIINIGFQNQHLNNNSKVD